MTRDAASTRMHRAALLAVAEHLRTYADLEIVLAGRLRTTRARVAHLLHARRLATVVDLARMDDREALQVLAAVRRRLG